MSLRIVLEPCAALDPIATRRLEQLMLELKQHHTLVLVTHNLQQAARVSDMKGLCTWTRREAMGRAILVEFAPTQQLFQQPRELATQQYLSGDFG